MPLWGGRRIYGRRGPATRRSWSGITGLIKQAGCMDCGCPTRPTKVHVCLSHTRPSLRCGVPAEHGSLEAPVRIDRQAARQWLGGKDGIVTRIEHPGRAQARCRYPQPIAHGIGMSRGRANTRHQPLLCGRSLPMRQPRISPCTPTAPRGRSLARASP